MPYIPGAGTTVATSSGAIGQVVTITPPSISADPIDVTHLGSVWHEKYRSIPDGGDASFTLEHDMSADHSGLLDTVLTSTVMRTWTVTLNSTTGATPPIITFTGYVSALDFGELAIDNVLTLDVSIAVSGVTGAGAAVTLA